MMTIKPFPSVEW